MQDMVHEKIYQAAICFVIQTEREIARKLSSFIIILSVEANNADGYY